jgi:flavin-dependent dehydrogenase
MKGFDVIIIGGGLAGLVNAILLSKEGLSVLVCEKKSYPFHRVCGEYISNEVVPFLKIHDIYPDNMGVSQIDKFMLTSTNGKKAEMPLDLGGFGVSRYVLDEFLYRKAASHGVEFRLNTTVDKVDFEGNMFIITLKDEILQSKLVIGAHGKRSVIDKKLARNFITKRSPYIGVKYHIKTDFPSDFIALHNFQNGYCGISKIEDEKFNLCYLSHQENLKRFGNIDDMQEAVLYQNPFLKSIFTNSDFLFEKPEVINEISFEQKALVENHILMCGDAAGMITPLCGNGMAMAIHSAKILSESILSEWNNGSPNRNMLEQKYIKRWNHMFHFRLCSGRKIQNLFGSKISSNIAVNLAKIKPVSKTIMKLTHGNPF